MWRKKHQKKPLCEEIVMIVIDEQEIYLDIAGSYLCYIDCNLLHKKTDILQRPGAHNLGSHEVLAGLTIEFRIVMACGMKLLHKLAVLVFRLRYCHPAEKTVHGVDVCSLWHCCGHESGSFCVWFPGSKRRSSTPLPTTLWRQFQSALVQLPPNTEMQLTIRNYSRWLTC